MNAEIELRDLRHLHLLAEEMNFSRAAIRAHLSQTAFSRSIQSIERRYGLRLFDRSTRHVIPTAACLQLLDGSRSLLARARDLSRELQHLTGSLGGELHFGASLLAVDCFLQGLLPALRHQSPNLRLNIIVGQWARLQQHLEEESIEFFVAYPAALATDARFHVTNLPAQPASVFCRPDHPILRGSPRLRLNDLLPYPWASIQFAPEITEGLRRLTGVASVDDLPLAMSCDNQDLLREMTLHTDHLLFTWTAWLERDIARGEIVDLHERLRRQVPEAIFQISCAIVRLAGRTPSPLANAMMQLIEQKASRA